MSVKAKYPWKRKYKSVRGSCTKTAQEDISMGIGSTPKLFGVERDLYEDPLGSVPPDPGMSSAAARALASAARPRFSRALCPEA